MITHFDQEFKLELTKAITKNAILVSQASKEYNIPRTTISRWAAEYKRYKK